MLMAVSGTYTQNYCIYCYYAVCASEISAISDKGMKTNIET